MSVHSSVSFSSPPNVREEVVIPDFRARYAERARDLRLRYSLIGKPRMPVVAVFGGISATAEVTGQANGSSGWWHQQVGPGGGVDTERFRILSFEYVCRHDLPNTACRAIGTEDQADALFGLLEALDIDALHAVVGASYGAMVGLTFAARHPARTERLIAIAGAHRAHPFTTALRGLQRCIIRGGGANGVALARALALTTYLTPEFFATRFPDSSHWDAQQAQFPAADYLIRHGRKYATHAAADRYLDLSESLDLHSIEPERITLPVALIAFDSDLIVPLAQMQELAERLAGPVRLHVIESVYGHDAFLHEHVVLSPLLRTVLRKEFCHVA